MRDFACGRQSLFPFGTRSSIRRVVASSDSKSGNRRARALSCLLDFDFPVAFLAALLALPIPFLPAFFADFFGFFDLLEDLERADVLAMIDFY